MARFGLGLAAVAAAMLMLGATPASACEAHATTAEAKDTKAKETTTVRTQKDARNAPEAKPATAPAPAPEAKPASAPQSCKLRPADGALAGKCSCGGPSDCTCKKNDCQCPKCGKRAPSGESQDV